MARKSTKRKKDFPKGKIAELRAELRKKEREFNEIKELLQRIQAEFENSMKRKEKEMEIREEKARASILFGFLPILDSVEEALKQSPKDAGLAKLKEQLVQLFKSNNVQEIACEHSFDPNKMECMVRTNDPRKEDNSVLEVFQKGYTYKGSVLRPAKVKINVHEEKRGDK